VPPPSKQTSSPADIKQESLEPSVTTKPSTNQGNSSPKHPPKLLGSAPYKPSSVFAVGCVVGPIPGPPALPARSRHLLHPVRAHDAPSAPHTGKHSSHKASSSVSKAASYSSHLLQSCMVLQHPCWLAVSIAETGSAAGRIIYPVNFTNLIDKVGFGWIARVIGFVAVDQKLQRY
jgi:hypothetical protein